MNHTVDGAWAAKPKLREFARRADAMPTTVGVSRHVFATIPLPVGIELNLKLEGLTPGGSIKDKAAKEMLEAAISSGAITSGSIILESTSGNLGIALARRCAELGLPFHAVIDPNASLDAVGAMRAAGADITLVDKPDAQGGFLGTRLEKVHELCARDARYYWTDQYGNPANPRAHEKTTAPEIADSFEHIDSIYIGFGTGGTGSGVGRFMKRHRPNTKIIAIDAEGSVTFGGKPGKRHIPGLGTSQRPTNCDVTVIDDLQMVSEADAIVACRWLAKRRGLLLGGSTGSVIAGTVQHRRRRMTDQAAVCVGISPDSGEKYLSTIFNDRWVLEHFGSDPIVRGASEELEV